MHSASETKTLLRHTLLPPSGHRVDGQRVPTGKIGGSPAPNITMQRSRRVSRPAVGSEHPLIVALWLYPLLPLPLHVIDAAIEVGVVSSDFLRSKRRPCER